MEANDKPKYSFSKDKIPGIDHEIFAEALEAEPVGKRTFSGNKVSSISTKTQIFKELVDPEPFEVNLDSSTIFRLEGIAKILNRTRASKNLPEYSTEDVIGLLIDQQLSHTPISDVSDEVKAVASLPRQRRRRKEEIILSPAIVSSAPLLQRRPAAYKKRAISNKVGQNRVPSWKIMSKFS